MRLKVLWGGVGMELFLYHLHGALDDLFTLERLCVCVCVCVRAQKPVGRTKEVIHV